MKYEVFMNTLKISNIMSKKICTIITAVLLTATVWAQSPEKMSYQAVIRDASNALVTNTSVGMQISILQGSASGTVVYTETQTPSTNANGLVSIEIGGGTGFNTINWANGPYFIKTETDLAGETNYTITGTSQLLSVPYALYSKTAETITGTISETDPVYTGSEAANITTTDITNLSNLSGVNTGDQDLSYSVGDFAQGGIVFWVDETGQHGLVCAKTDQGAAVRWDAGTLGNTQAKGDGPFSGEANTSIIIAAQVAIGDDNVTYAARICNELQITEGGKTYGDWYLPSKEELNLMYQNKSTIDATAVANSGSAFYTGAVNIYWSSTEYGINHAWSQTFTNGSQNSSMKNFTGCRVRAIRAF